MYLEYIIRKKHDSGKETEKMEKTENENLFSFLHKVIRKMKEKKVKFMLIVKLCFLKCKRKTYDFGFPYNSINSQFMKKNSRNFNCNFFTLKIGRLKYMV